jgi:hypothetical protein
MAIVVVKRPNDKSWSGNPIHYQIYSAAAEADSTIVFEIMIMFKRTDAADFSEIITLPYNPVKGIAKLDIEEILKGLLEYETPGIPDDFEYASPTTCRKQTGKFYIKFREITTAVPDPPWTSSESEFERFIIKGGISFQKWRGPNYWENYFEPRKPFLTWQLSGRLASRKERMYLTWYNYTAYADSYLKMRRTAVFSDGSQLVTDLNCPSAEGEVILFPSGYDQLKLGVIDTTKRIHYWEMQMWNINLAIPISEKFRYYLDNRNDKNEITLNYRNSLGGLDSVRVRGVIEYNLDRKFEEVEGIVNHNYFEGNHIDPKVKSANSTETLVYKGDIGFVSKKEQDRLRDSHFKRECWWEQQKKWLPVRIITPSQKLKSSADQLWSMPIEFSIADNGDEHYTPPDINLAEGALESVVLCNAVISVLSVNHVGDSYQVDWNLVSGAPAKYQISTAAIAGGAPYDTTDTQWTYSFLPPGSHIVRVTPMCLIGGEYIAGVSQEIEIDVPAACVGVGISGAPDLPNAKVDSDYAYFFVLTGTAPFTLEDIVKPAWMTILVSGNTINFSGKPATGDIGADIPVSFKIKNCGGGNSVDFADTLNVTEPDYGLIIWNTQTCLVDEVSPTFYLIEEGSFPVTPGQKVKATHGGYPPVITVKITLLTGPVKIQVSVDAVVVNTINVVSNGYYNFTSGIYGAGQKMEIKIIAP